MRKWQNQRQGYPRIGREVGFIDDVFRHEWWPAKEFFIDLLTGPIEAVTSRRPGPSVRRKMWTKGLIDNRSPAAFDAARSTDQRWLQWYETLPESIGKTVLDFVDRSAFHFAYEASPGLCRLLDGAGVRFVDFRISPLRFLPDLVIALRSNEPRINRLLADLALTYQDIRLEAGKLAASYRHLEAYLRPSHPPGSVYLIGQTPDDASIITNGEFERIGNHLPALASFIAGRPVYYQPHPKAAHAHQVYELTELHRIASHVEISNTNIYDLLSSGRELSVFGLSSGALQEAEFFDKPVLRLLDPICPLEYPDRRSPRSDGYWQVPFETFIDPHFIAALLGARSNIAPTSFRGMRPNYLRELHNAWWGYARHIARPSELSLVQHPDMRVDIRALKSKVEFLAQITTEEPRQSLTQLAPLMGHFWRWNDGNRVTFDVSGTVMKAGKRAGIYRRLLGQSHRFIIVWDGAQWLDAVEADSDWNILSCRNNSGATFQITHE